MTRRKPTVIVISAAALACAHADAQPRTTTAVPAATSPAAALPDTLPGRCARDFLAMLSNPTPEKVCGFESAWSSARRLGQASVEQRIERFAAIHADHGVHTPVEVAASAPDSIELVVARAVGEPVRLKFLFDPHEAGKLEGVLFMPVDDRPMPVTAERRRALVAAAATSLRESYVFPELGATMADAIESNLDAGAYDAFADEFQFTQHLTADLRAISKDGHLRVGVDPGGAAAPQGDDALPSAEERATMRRGNYAFAKAELLPGNVGYLRFDAFIDDAEARETAAAAMSFLAHADALVVDLRHNGGGSPAMIAFLTAYLVDSPTLLNTMLDREGKVVEEWRTPAEVPGRRLGSGVPLYILTSRRTYSGAEEFSYNLKNLGRATIVGETTGGGAHPTRAHRLDDRVVIRVPYLRAHNPITRTNWEGTGVAPDVKTTAADALDRALQLARDELKSRASAPPKASSGR